MFPAESEKQHRANFTDKSLQSLRSLKFPLRKFSLYGSLLLIKNSKEDNIALKWMTRAGDVCRISSCWFMTLHPSTILCWTENDSTERSTKHSRKSRLTKIHRQNPERACKPESTSKEGCCGAMNSFVQRCFLPQTLDRKRNSNTEQWVTLPVWGTVSHQNASTDLRQRRTHLQ